MNLSFALSIACFLVGLIVLLIQRRFNEVFGGLFLGGLIAALLEFGGHASLHIG